MSTYKNRTIVFRDLVYLDKWAIKLYTISKDLIFNADESLNKAVANLPLWLQMHNSFNSSNEKHAFLIVHEATEGVFAIINWWVGKNMLNTHIFFSDHDNPGRFKLISGDGLAPCIWELEVINHERISWINNVLKKPDAPDYKRYLEDQYNGVL